MAMIDEVRTLFAGHCFGPPCTEDDVRLAEAALSGPLPACLREMYLAFDGFRGPTGAAFFWPLFGPDGLVEMNLFYRGDDLFPQELVSRCSFFGDDGGGPLWGVVQDLPGKVIQWSPAWGPRFHVIGESPLDVWRSAKQAYDSLGGDD